MRTKASLLRFPLHPVLVSIALGAIPTALVLDALYVWQADRAWHQGAFVASALGAAALLAGIVPGFVDYFANVPRRGEVWKHANVHMLLGLALAGYFTLGAIARFFTIPDPGPAAAWSALLMSGLGVLGLLVQAYLGRGLVLRHFIGVERDHVPDLPPGHREHVEPEPTAKGQTRLPRHQQ